MQVQQKLKLFYRMRKYHIVAYPRQITIDIVMWIYLMMYLLKGRLTCTLMYVLFYGIVSLLLRCFPYKRYHYYPALRCDGLSYEFTSVLRSWKKKNARQIVSFHRIVLETSKKSLRSIRNFRSRNIAFIVVAFLITVLNYCLHYRK